MDKACPIFSFERLVSIFFFLNILMLPKSGCIDNWGTPNLLMFSFSLDDNGEWMALD